jgi:hypothetical protein
MLKNKFIIPPHATMPREGWIPWTTNCETRQILLDDLRSGLLPVNADELSAEEAWDLVYQHMAEFVPVVFSQFKVRLKDHRKQVGADITWDALESEALTHDRSLFPRQTEQNHRGEEPICDLSTAKLLLRDDVEAGKHHHMTSSQIQ